MGDPAGYAKYLWNDNNNASLIMRVLGTCACGKKSIGDRAEIRNAAK
jgi:hypothetical protein